MEFYLQFYLAFSIVEGNIRCAYSTNFEINAHSIFIFDGQIITINSWMSMLLEKITSFALFMEPYAVERDV